jgi:hypothetical protein
MEEPSQRPDDCAHDDYPDPVHGIWMPAAAGSKRLDAALQLGLLRLVLLVREDPGFMEVA